jgi:hypothetical protein
MSWEVEIKAPVQQWRRSLDPVTADRFSGALEHLRQRGPGLGRPFADSVKGARHHNMKELRVGNMRALYAFDSRRTAVLLVAGDKTNDWQGWYRRNIPAADRLLDQHQRRIGGGGRQWPVRATPAKGQEMDR